MQFSVFIFALFLVGELLVWMVFSSSMGWTRGVYHEKKAQLEIKTFRSYCYFLYQTAMSSCHLTPRGLYFHIYRKTERMSRCSCTDPNSRYLCRGIPFFSFEQTAAS